MYAAASFYIAIVLSERSWSQKLTRLYTFHAKCAIVHATL